MVELAAFLFVCFKVQRTHARFLTKETQATKTKQKTIAKQKEYKVRIISWLDSFGLYEWLIQFKVFGRQKLGFDRESVAMARNTTEVSRAMRLPCNIIKISKWGMRHGFCKHYDRKVCKPTGVLPIVLLPRSREGGSPFFSLYTPHHTTRWEK